MVWNVVQEKKEMLTADFGLFDDQGERLGGAGITGQMTTYEVTVVGHLLDYSYSLTSRAMSYLKSAQKGKDKVYRLYAVTMGGKDVGAVYSNTEKLGHFKTTSYLRLWLEDEHYELYFVSPEKDKDSYGCVYHGDRQIALITEPWIIRDDFFPCQIVAEDTRAAVVAYLGRMYRYGTVLFKRGTKGAGSVEKRSTKTEDPLLLAKYDPAFRDSLAPGVPLPWEV